MKRSVIAAVVLAVGLCLGQVAQANFSTDSQFMVVFQPGITWDRAAAEVAGWGSSFQLATIDSRAEQRYLQNLISGFRGDFWIGGYQNGSDQPLWLSGNQRGYYSHWAPWEPIDYFSPVSKGHPSVSNSYGGKHERYDWRWSQWAWRDWGWNNLDWNDSGRNGKAQPQHISGFIVEKLEPQDPTSTPILPAVWLLGSGLAVMGIARASRRQRTR